MESIAQRFQELMELHQTIVGLLLQNKLLREQAILTCQLGTQQVHFS